VQFDFCKDDQPKYHQGGQLNHHVYSPTKFNLIYCQLRAKNMCLSKETNQISLVHLNAIGGGVMKFVGPYDKRLKVVGGDIGR
jgi:hypothetical protein